MWVKIEQASEFGKHLGKKVAVGINENSLSKEESGTIVQDENLGVCVLTNNGKRMPLDNTMLAKLVDENRSIFMWAAPTEAIFPEPPAIHTGGTQSPVDPAMGADSNGEQANLPTGDQELNQAATTDEVQT